MKKTLVIAAFAAALIPAAFAQQTYRYVTPVLVECKQFNIQTLRDSAVNETEYAAQLNALAKDLADEKNEIDNAAKGLKLEKSLYDAMMSSYKTRKGQVETAQKNYNKDLKTYESLLKDIQKQNDIIRKMNLTEGESVRGHAARLEEQQDHYKSEMKHIQDLLDELNARSNNELNSTFTILNDYLIEITDKETRLKNLAAQNKTNIEIVKSAQKAIKGK